MLFGKYKIEFQISKCINHSIEVEISLHAPGLEKMIQILKEDIAKDYGIQPCHVEIIDIIRLDRSFSFYNDF